MFGKSSWRYFYPPSFKGRGKGKLIYDRNDVMESGKPGDILVIAKKSSDEILLLIVQKDSRYEQELYDVLNLGVKKASATQSQSLKTTGGKI